MSIENDKYKEHINELYECNKEQALDYAFTKYYEYEKEDNELANFFFNIIGQIILEIYIGPKNINKHIKVSEYDKRLIIDVAYQYSYEKVTALRGPLKNVFGELFHENVDEPFILPYIELIKVIQNTKERSSKIAN